MVIYTFSHQVFVLYFLHVFQNKQGYQNDGHVMFLWTRSDVTESRNTSCALLLNFLFVALEVPVCLQRRGLILQRAVRVGQLHPRVLSVCATVCLHSVWELQHCVLQASRSLCVSLLLLPSFNNCYLYCWLIPIPAAFACCSLHLQQALYCFHCRDMCVKGSGDRDIYQQAVVLITNIAAEIYARWQAMIKTFRFIPLECRLLCNCRAPVRRANSNNSRKRTWTIFVHTNWHPSELHIFL